VLSELTVVIRITGQSPQMKDVYFITFPTDKSKLEWWVRACLHEGFTADYVTWHTFICSRHFVGDKVRPLFIQIQFWEIFVMLRYIQIGKVWCVVLLWQVAVNFVAAHEATVCYNRTLNSLVRPGWPKPPTVPYKKKYKAIRTYSIYNIHTTQTL